MKYAQLAATLTLVGLVGILTLFTLNPRYECWDGRSPDGKSPQEYCDLYFGDESAYDKFVFPERSAK